MPIPRSSFLFYLCVLFFLLVLNYFFSSWNRLFSILEHKILFFITKNFKKNVPKLISRKKVKLCCLFEFDRMSFTSPILHPCLSKWSPRWKQIFTKFSLLHILCFFCLNIHTNKIISIVPMKNSLTISFKNDLISILKVDFTWCASVI